MRSKRSFYILLAVTIVAVAAAVLSQRTAEEYTATHGLHAPDLGERAGDIQAVVIGTADGELRLERTGDRWVAANKDGYPADAGRIRSLVLGLSRLERLEKKTSDPQRLARLELSDVDEPGSKAVKVSLLDGGGQTLAAVLVGKTEDFQSTDYSRYFVRDAGDSQSWLVRGTLPPVLEDFGNWLEQELLPGVEQTGFRSVTVAQPGEQAVTVRRETKDQKDFQLAGLAGGETVDSQYAVNQIADALQRLSLKEVQAAGDAAVDDPVLTVEALTFNGVRITARFGRGEPDYRVVLSAAYEPAEDHNSEGGGDPAGDDTDTGGETDAGGTDGDNENEGGQSGDTGAAGGEELAKMLDERWEGRAFIVSQYALDALMVKRSDLVKPAGESGAQ